eukprot:TRINITY_DN6967_c0_g1_i1.p1 TRINITY_DN6967_c0_g1~~TRINITY_DN6967_c0_g1_i1.p1  ORF type:complete len:267 (+),score=57.58 TRINITY_DN6967_c0_g1_i1:81-881(+)
MSDEDIPTFESIEEECKFWKKLATERKEDLEDLEEDYKMFKETSTSVESELEGKLKKTQSNFRQFKQTALDKFEQHKRQTQDLNTACEQLRARIVTLETHEAQLLEKKRILEQENDDLQRRERESIASQRDLAEKFEKSIEEDALLQSKLEELRVGNSELIARLRQTISEQKAEIAAQQLEHTKNKSPTDPDSMANGTSPKLHNPLSNGVSKQTANHVPQFKSPNAKMKSRFLDSEQNPVVLLDRMISLVQEMETRLQHGEIGVGQ